MASYQPHFPLALDSLYCEEEHWDNGEVENGDKRFTEEESRFLADFMNPVVLLEQDLIWEDEELSSLLSREQENELYRGIQENPSLAKARVEAVEWILKVIEYYSFSTLTAVLAVNYLDRFLCGFRSHFHNEKPWMTQLAAVACLSLAAKVEETRVPLLLDFQVQESKYVFEAKTIQRMEILVLSTLQWKMNPVTPLSFLDYTARRLGLKSKLCSEFLRRCEFLLLSIITDYNFMCYLPSTLASATMLYIFSCLDPCIGLEYQDQLLNILEINKGKVEECGGLVQEVATRIQFHSLNRMKFVSLPGSPKGIMDVSFSFDSSKDSWKTCSSAATSVSSSPEPLFNKIKNLHTPNEADTFSYSHQV